MRSIYDAAVVMESGFGPDGDIYGNSRLETALACIKQKEAKNLILTGSLERQKILLRRVKLPSKRCAAGKNKNSKF